MSQLQELMDKLWEDYIQLNPHAKEVYDVLVAEGEQVQNDHIAFRTFDHRLVNIDQLAVPFLEGGYRECGQYTFTEKKLNARHFEHSDERMPKVFISELKTSEFSPAFQTLVEVLINQVSDDLPRRWDFPACGRPWNVSYDKYEQLSKESEYAAWLAAFGFRANHFTVYVNGLEKYNDLPALNAFLKEKGFALNDSGGEIKGSPEVFLEQSSIMAKGIPVKFTNGEHTIPACYYEFAKRYPMEDGKLFQGFVAKSADKIFESTDRPS